MHKVTAIELSRNKTTFIESSADAEIISVGERKGVLTLWILEDDDPDLAIHGFRVRALSTGVPVFVRDKRHIHIGTVVCEDGDIQHVFELSEPES